MIALIRKNLRLWGYGKSLALFAGCILFSISGRLNGGIAYERHILSAVFSTGLTIVSFRLMLYAVLMKCLDILVQYLIMLGIYIATRQVTIGFLVLVAGNLLCIIPGNWVAYSPFGLSSLTRISVVEPGIGISAVSAFGIEAAILTLMIAGILMWGYKKILN